MVERHSAFGAFPNFAAAHPFAEQDEDREEGARVTFGSNTAGQAPTSVKTTSASNIFFQSGDEESSWSEGLVDEKQSEEVEFVDELITTDDEKSDDLGVKGVESYDEDGDYLESVCTEDGSVAQGPLLWRQNPKNSWSDWKIIVAEEDDADTTTYHVHKALLASGPRRSRYFRRLFRTDEVADNSKRSCEIKLPRLSAQAFPLFLDLLYDQSIRVDHKDAGIRKHAVALYQLADTYQVSDLVKEIRTQFIPNIGLADACPYYQDAVTFDPPVRTFLDHILNVCTCNVLRLDVASPLLRAMEPEFVLAILETERRRETTRVTAGAQALHVSRHLSTLIVAYVAYYCDVLPGTALPDGMLQQLTQPAYIPSIDFSVTLEWSRIVVPKIRRMYKDKDNNVPATVSSDPALNIQLRCLESIKDNITKVDLEDPTSEYRNFLKSLPADIAVDATLELTRLRQTVQQDALLTTKYETLQQRNAALQATVRQQGADCQSLRRQYTDLTNDLSRFELVSPCCMVGKKIPSLKKVTTTVPVAVPAGVALTTTTTTTQSSSRESGHLQVNGRPLFWLRPPQPTTTTGSSGSGGVGGGGSPPSSSSFLTPKRGSSSSPNRSTATHI